MKTRTIRRQPAGMVTVVGRTPTVSKKEVQYIKPIFHCDAKTFALGPGVSLDPQRHNFALEIPTCLYLYTLKFVLPPTQNKREPMEYRLCWVPNAKFQLWPYTFHVVCAHLICVGYLTRTQFALEYGLKADHTNNF